MIDISGFGTCCQFSSEAIAALTEAWKKLEKYQTSKTVFTQCRELLFAETGEPWDQLAQLAEKTGVHLFAVHQLFLIFCAEHTHVNYQKAGYADSL